MIMDSCLRFITKNHIIMQFKYLLCFRNWLCVTLMSLRVLSMCTLTDCNTPVTRPQPKFEIVEDLDVQTEGLLDLGLEVRAKIHNYGATGSQKIKFKLGDDTIFHIRVQSQ